MIKLVRVRASKSLRDESWEVRRDHAAPGLKRIRVCVSGTELLDCRKEERNRKWIRDWKTSKETRRQRETERDKERVM